MENYVVVRSGLSLSTIGVITGIVLTVLEVTGVINIGIFWATFPFWIVPAASLALFIIFTVIALIIGAIVSKGDN